jgi:hypothetical protein
MVQKLSVPHPFRVLQQKGWETTHSVPPIGWVPQVRGPHGQVFVRGVEFRIFGPGKPTNSASPKNQPTTPRSASPARWAARSTCHFCLTARLGLQRNLTAGEIAGQVLAVFDRHAVEVGRDRVNLVFMGMGEPFLNYDNFMGAVRLLVREVGLSPQRMTVSTSGIVPGIERFAAEPPELRPKLAISLNAPNDRSAARSCPSTASGPSPRWWTLCAR